MDVKQRLVFAGSAIFALSALAFLIGRPESPLWCVALCLSGSFLAGGGANARPAVSSSVLILLLAALALLFGLLAYADWLGEHVMPESSGGRFLHLPIWASAAVVGVWLLVLLWRFRVVMRLQVPGVGRGR